MTAYYRYGSIRGQSILTNYTPYASTTMSDRRTTSRQIPAPLLFEWAYVTVVVSFVHISCSIMVCALRFAARPGPNAFGALSDVLIFLPRAEVSNAARWAAGHNSRGSPLDHGVAQDFISVLHIIVYLDPAAARSLCARHVFEATAFGVLEPALAEIRQRL